MTFIIICPKLNIDKRLIAAATVKTPYFDNSASKIIFFLQKMNMLDIFNSRNKVWKAAKN